MIGRYTAAMWMTLATQTTPGWKLLPSIFTMRKETVCLSSSYMPVKDDTCNKPVLIFFTLTPVALSLQFRADFQSRLGCSFVQISCLPFRALLYITVR